MCGQTDKQTNKQTNKQDKTNIVTGGTGDYNKQIMTGFKGKRQIYYLRETFGEAILNLKGQIDSPFT